MIVKLQTPTSNIQRMPKVQTSNSKLHMRASSRTRARKDSSLPPECGVPARVGTPPSGGSGPLFEAWRFSEVWSLKFGVFLSMLSLAAPMSAQTLLLTGATAHTVSPETLSPRQVLIRDGKIAAVGKTVPAGGATSIALKGQHLYPGMIALNSMLGLVEIEDVRATREATEAGEYTPEGEEWIAVNPDS